MYGVGECSAGVVVGGGAVGAEPSVGGYVDDDWAYAVGVVAAVALVADEDAGFVVSGAASFAEEDFEGVPED